MSGQSTPPRRGGVVRTVLGGVIFALVFAAIVLGIVQVVINIWPDAAIPAYGVVIFLAVIGLYGGVVYLQESSGSDLKKQAEANAWLYDGPASSFGAVVGYFLICVVGSGELFRYWNLKYGGFIAPDDSYWSWALYGVSWVQDNVLANFGQIFGWQVVHIEPITIATRSAVWAYNIVLELFLIGATVRLMRVLSRGRSSKAA